MIPYTPVELLFFFFFYCFCGWIIECTYVSVLTKKITNRGFMIGPFIPIYGFGAMTLLLACTPVKKYPVLVFIVGMVAASVLEYFTGALMEAIFKVRYWDYSERKFNINGHVCLLNSTYWGGIALLQIYFFHKPVEALVKHMRYKELNLCVMCLAMYFMVDLTLSFKAAFDIRNAIVKLEKYKNELRIMQKRLDVMLAYTSDSVNETKDKIEDMISDKLGDLADSVESKMSKVKDKLDDRIPANVKEEYFELRDKFAGIKSNRFGLSHMSDFYKKAIIKGNPISSHKYKDSIEAIKKFITSEE